MALLPVDATDETDRSGQYEFVNPIPGSAVKPVADPPASGMVTIDVVDAILALKAASGEQTLGSLQRLTADVSGNGVISGYDAGLILQKSVKADSIFPVTTRCSWGWVFEPAPKTLNQSTSPPQVLRFPCTQGQILYEDALQGTLDGQNFIAAAFGDVDTALPTRRGRTTRSERLRLGRPQRTSDRVRFPVYVEGDSYHGMQFELSFDESRFRIDRVRKLKGATSGMSASNADAGTLRYAMASSEPMEGGAVLMIELEALDRSAPLEFAIQSSEVVD